MAVLFFTTFLFYSRFNLINFAKENKDNIVQNAQKNFFPDNFDITIQ